MQRKYWDLKLVLNKILDIQSIVECILVESKHLSDEEKEILKQFRESAPGNIHPSTAEKYKKAQGRITNYKENMENSDEAGKNILKGQIKREKQQNIQRFNKEASEKNPNLKKMQKDKIWQFIRMKQAKIGKDS